MDAQPITVHVGDRGAGKVRYSFQALAHHMELWTDGFSLEITLRRHELLQLRAAINRSLDEEARSDPSSVEAETG
jgi:hypothetical protein